MEDDLKFELAYVQSLLNVVKGNETFANMPKVKERLNMLGEMVAEFQGHYVTSKDTDARVEHKSEEDSFFGYKTHIAMSDKRIITAATITSGEKGDAPQLETLVKESRKNGMEVDVVGRHRLFRK